MRCRSIWLIFAALKTLIPTVSTLPIGFINSKILTRKHPLTRVSRFPPRHDSNSPARHLYSSFEDIRGGMSRNLFLLSLGGVLVSLPPLLEIYSRLGATKSDFPSELFPPPQSGNWDDVEHATLVFHGSGGQDQYTDNLMSKLQTSKNSEYSSMIEWSQFSSNILQASFNAQRIGREAGAQLMQKASNLKTIQIIGISVGAFGADAASTEIKSTTTEKKLPFVQLTLLDPFTQRGIFDVGYGNRTFGKSADYVEQYLNTDDPVPSTNAPLDDTVCFDVTNLRPDDVFGHDWPLVYYAQSGKVGLVAPEKRLKRGTLIVVKQ